jgi:hypothetical protein
VNINFASEGPSLPKVKREVHAPPPPQSSLPINAHMFIA